MILLVSGWNSAFRRGVSNMIESRMGDVGYTGGCVGRVLFGVVEFVSDVDRVRWRLNDGIWFAGDGLLCMTGMFCSVKNRSQTTHFQSLDAERRYRPFRDQLPSCRTSALC